MSHLSFNFFGFLRPRKKGTRWLGKDWQRINDTDGQRTNEYWRPEKDGSLKGIYIVFIENLDLKKINSKWQLIVSGVHKDPKYFEVIS
jgi:hypothetical protein